MILIRLSLTPLRISARIWIGSADRSWKDSEWLFQSSCSDLVRIHVCIVEKKPVGFCPENF